MVGRSHARGAACRRAAFQTRKGDPRPTPAADGKMTWLLDLEGYSRKNSPPIRMALQTLHILQNHFPERLGLAVCYQTPLVFECTSSGWGVDGWHLMSPKACGGRGSRGAGGAPARRAAAAARAGLAPRAPWRRAAVTQCSGRFFPATPSPPHPRTPHAHTHARRDVASSQGVCGCHDQKEAGIPSCQGPARYLVPSSRCRL